MVKKLRMTVIREALEGNRVRTTEDLLRQAAKHDASERFYKDYHRGLYWTLQHIQTHYYLHSTLHKSTPTGWDFNWERSPATITRSALIAFLGFDLGNEEETALSSDIQIYVAHRVRDLNDAQRGGVTSDPLEGEELAEAIRVLNDTTKPHIPFKYEDKILSDFEEYIAEGLGTPMDFVASLGGFGYEEIDVTDTRFPETGTNETITNDKKEKIDGQ